MRTMTLILLCAIATSGCALFGNKPRPGSIGQLMANAAAKQQTAASEGGSESSANESSEQLRQTAMRNYRHVLARTTNPKQQAMAMRRLAALELDDQRDRQSNGQKTGTQESRDAIRLYRKALKLDPGAQDNAMALYQLARAYQVSGDRQQTLKTLGQLVDRYPKSWLVPEAHFRRGEILFSDRRYGDAAQAFGKVHNQYSVNELIAGRAAPSRFKEQAIYMHGWSLLEDSRYHAAIGQFLHLLNYIIPPQDFGSTHINFGSMSAARKSLVKSTLRGTSLSFSSLPGKTPINDYLAKKPEKLYEPLLYAELARFYIRKDRYADAARTDLAFVDRHPSSPLAPHFERLAIITYSKGGLPTETVHTRERFVHDFLPGAAFWTLYRHSVYPKLDAAVRTNLIKVARYYNAQGQSAQKPSDKTRNFRTSAQWYRRFIETYPNDDRVPELRYQMADTLLQSGQYDKAAVAFNDVAYDHPASSKHAADAAYAAFLARVKEADSAKGPEAEHDKRLAAGAALRLANKYPQQKGVLPALTRSAQILYSIPDYTNAIILGQRVLSAHPQADPQTRRAAAIVVAQSHFERGDYPDAAKAYQIALSLPEPARSAYSQSVSEAPEVTKTQLKHRLVVSMYKQADAERESGNLNAAAKGYLHASQITSDPDTRQKALYDASAALIAGKHWGQAIIVLQHFDASYPHSKLHAQVQRKLAVSYEKDGQPGNAAQIYMHIAHDALGKHKIRREAARQAVQLYGKADDNAQTMQAATYYVAHFPTPVEPAEDMRDKLVKLNSQNGDEQAANHWREAIIHADKAAGQAGTAHTHYLAAHAALALADNRRQAFSSLQLTMPFKRSLARKKDAMQKALLAYHKAADYNLSGVTTEATYRIAQIYENFSQSIEHSPRPKNLSGLELQQYNVLLEDQADSFDQKAVNIYETNAKRVQAGVYDKWVKRSIKQLAKLYPARYDKTEISAHVIEASR